MWGRRRGRAVFQPNAHGRGEMRSWAGFQQRQLLKSCGQYLGERAELIVADGVVTARVVGPFGVRLRRAGCWPVDQLLAVEVAPEGVDAADGVSWPAFALVELTTVRIVAELRAVAPNSACDELLSMLVPPPTVPITWVEIEERRRAA